MEELLQEARRLDLSSVEGRFRLGELAEALHCQLPTVADLHERLALDLELDPDTLTEAWYVASAFPPLTRHPGLPWTAYVTLRFHPQRHGWLTAPSRSIGTRLASTSSSELGSPPS
jgi:hypothetical protein